MVQRAEPYLAFIRQEVENRNLPRELIYLPIVESEYTPTAVSRAGAAGLWQFMENSIASFDMRINEWYDERFDFWKSTVGALAKLEQNYREWNDWPLALAAYNAGLGGIRQIVSRSGTTDYWVLSAQQRLKVETIHFVPKLLAISYILSNPRGFGLANLWPETVVWERIPVPRQVDLGMLANAAGISSAELKKANGELKYSVTPPDSRYFLKVRAKDAAAVRAVFARSDISLLRYYVYTVKSGDTLSALASHYGVSVNRILEANPGTRAESLRISARLVIPAYKDVAPYTGRIINSALTSQFTGTHQVKKGETLWSIAQVYNTSPEALAEANGMHVSDILSEGRNLKTPSH
ncbi:lytic transglycosylase [Spirochaetia bacterium]|nr:lytic transglycosylase [Spirochaetia bacterium]GHU31678.1 lytic transglycosylase [Spirochaetia bacterium]